MGGEKAMLAKISRKSRLEFPLRIFGGLSSTTLPKDRWQKVCRSRRNRFRKNGTWLLKR
jgi:hypothetical protein